MNYIELRRLLTDKSPDPQTANCRLANAAVDALPGLLEENERLVSNLALTNRCNDEFNQKLKVEVARRREHLERLDAIIKISNWRAARIAQLEAALQYVEDECVCADVVEKMRTALGEGNQSIGLGTGRMD